MAPIYNIETILEGFSYLIEEGFRGKLIVVGEGPEEKKLKKRAKDLGISDHVNFMGMVPHDKVAEYLRASQIYLSMSLSDGASTSLLEAMACGIYPIVSDIPANRKWIQDGDNSFLVPVRDAETLAQRIKEARSNTELRRRGVVKNLKIVKERGNFLKNMAVLEKLYKEVLRENRG